MVPAALRGAMEPPMTDQDPIPTTRMPVPEPPEPTTDGWPGTTVTDEAPEPEIGAAPPPSPPPPPAAAPIRRDGPDRGRTASILFGLAILGLGLWFFAEHTLGYELPRIRWSQVWPATLIVIGLWVVLGSMRRGSR
jgi:hypothetical protein